MQAANCQAAGKNKNETKRNGREGNWDSIRNK